MHAKLNIPYTDLLANSTLQVLKAGEFISVHKCLKQLSSILHIWGTAHFRANSTVNLGLMKATGLGPTDTTAGIHYYHSFLLAVPPTVCHAMPACMNGDSEAGLEGYCLAL